MTSSHALHEQPATQIPVANRRIQSVDILRGIVMVIMAIDHVRVYSGMPAGAPEAGIFFTRWITHYCAPSFAFFAGTSAFLYYRKTGSKNDLVRFLFTRGLLLVVLEMTVVRFFWTFNFDYANFTITGVIWMLGWSMILLSAFVRLRATTVAIIGMAIIFFQQIFLYVPNIFPESMQESVAKWWAFFYPSAVAGEHAVVLSGGSSGLPNVLGISVFYVIIPWVGVMMAGYGFGQILLMDHDRMKKICVRIGLAAIAIFIAVATPMILLFEDADTPFIFKLLGQQKYPPSQLFILMTLGPIILLVPWAERIKGWVADAFKIIGRVPMFYYLIHLLLIHLSAFALNQIVYGNIHQDWYESAPFVRLAEENRWGLPLLYLVWIIDVVILFYVCKWYATYKSKHREIGWTKYI
ncbi:MAG TPA: heparan-alpha-glucosaminide N-acetyltransferase domain-containing protein [Chryseolinea sp.]|nr:heparan-alpha-glucosaminide N-acetyltransferase domain-containing protein [Chryseolinea sp.]